MRLAVVVMKFEDFKIIDIATHPVEQGELYYWFTIANLFFLLFSFYRSIQHCRNPKSNQIS
jgi:hypothetical protein